MDVFRGSLMCVCVCRGSVMWVCVEGVYCGCV